MRKLTALAVAAVSVATVSSTAVADKGSQQPATVVAKATKTVAVGDNFFVKDGGVPTVSVKRGTTVKWRWVGSGFHNVTVTSGPAKFQSKSQSSGSFSKKMKKKGTYTLICTIHGGGDQKMKLKVK